MAIAIDRLSFRYGRKAVPFDSLDVVIPAGKTVLLGPNGAGKSTLLALTADGLRPQRGTISIDGIGSAVDRGNRAPYRRAVGWLPQTARAVPGLRVREHVAYCGWLKGLSRRDAWDRADGALQAVDLGDRADDSAGALSGGQTRRLGIASTLVAGARWLLLDEPTAGLDPAQRTRLTAVLQRLPEDVSLLTSTHQTEEIAATYEHAVVLDRGAVRYVGPLRELALRGADRTDAGADGLSAAYADLVGGDR